MTMAKNMETYENYLKSEEKTAATIDKYMRDVKEFVVRVGLEKISKEDVLSYKNALIKKYAPTSVNSILSSLNSFFTFCKRKDLCVKLLKIQRKIFSDKRRELTKAEYERLLSTAKKNGNERLYLIMQTICSTGIRVSELKFIDVQAVKSEQALICCKGKTRVVMLPKKLCSALKRYIEKRGIKGCVFQTKNGNPMDRSNIWSEMKRLCAEAGVDKRKVFPHNLRHLFARTFYSMQKDIVRLADILGHSSVDTTRIYTMESGETHRKQIQRLGLLFC